MRACLEKFSGVRCRPVSIQFLPDGTIAMFELTVQDDELRVVQERHYRFIAGEGGSRAGTRGAGVKPPRGPIR